LGEKAKGGGADVAGQMRFPTAGLEGAMEKCGCRAFAFGAGNADDGARTLL